MLRQPGVGCSVRSGSIAHLLGQAACCVFDVCALSYKVFQGRLCLHCSRSHPRARIYSPASGLPMPPLSLRSPPAALTCAASFCPSFTLNCSTTALAMENSCFPIEVCERIIDCCFHPQYPHSRGYATLKACALTCSAWLPRSRYNLFYKVDLGCREQCDQYLAVIAEHPERAGWVRVLAIYAKDRVYWPLSQLIAPHRHANCHELFLWVAWTSFPPHYVYKVMGPLLRRCANITKLEMHITSFLTFSEMSCIVLSIPQLQTLHIFGKPGSLWSRIHGQPKRRQSCTSLTELNIMGQFSPQCLFGTSIKHFH
ncbi:hypothetical protein OH77DRAFT_1300980 [Trametes cingulata]|nr:hypothetical protein OH77DRAFT_1300980 [Trametes cingulata]